MGQSEQYQLFEVFGIPHMATLMGLGLKCVYENINKEYPHVHHVISIAGIFAINLFH